MHVPYRGTPAAQSAVMAGDVHAMFDAIGSSVPLIQAGALRALGVTASARLRVLPDILADRRCCPGLRSDWFPQASARPRARRREIIERLNREINAALVDPTVKARMSELGSEIFTGSPAAFGSLIAEETEKWAKVVKFAGLRAD